MSSICSLLNNYMEFELILTFSSSDEKKKTGL